MLKKKNVDVLRKVYFFVILFLYEIRFLLTIASRVYKAKENARKEENKPRVDTML